ncbi:threonine synthase [Halovenus marina]|uniref:threonine synthase n=1 Tax=Halovenus marina TaxID=3396621 RepID=UPI003F54578B
METTDAFAGLRCLDCAEQFDPVSTTHRCPDCGGTLEPTYGSDELATATESMPDEPRGIADFAPVLPVPADSLLTTGEAATPRIDCPDLADEFGVGGVGFKAEGCNPTGGVIDRGMAVAVSVAREHGADEVALPTTGNGGQSAAAYASRAGLDSHSFAPSRTPFANKAMINVHGGEMTVVGGRYSDAREAFESAASDHYSLAPFATPYRHEGIKTLAYELHLDAEPTPDAVVCPTGHGGTLVGIYKGFRELATAGAIESIPHLYAAQAAGCDPIAAAWERGARTHDPVDHPDTICGPLEIPDPAGGSYVLNALETTGGAAVAVEDEAILEAAVSRSGAGVPTSATGGTAVAATRRLADQGAFEPNETVVLVDPATANREADILRSHLMKQGI